MDRSAVDVSFKLDAEEARRQMADLQKRSGVTEASVRFRSIVAVLLLVVGIAEVVTNYTKRSAWFLTMIGCAYVYVARSRRSLIINVPAGIETTIRFSIAGIVIERPAPRTLPWRAVEGGDRCDGAMALRFVSSSERTLHRMKRTRVNHATARRRR